MDAGTWVAAGLAVLDLILLASLVGRSDIGADRSGKILLLVSALVLPLLATVAAANSTINRSKQVSFCLSCHEMGKHGQSLSSDDDEVLPALHFQNNWVPQGEACSSC